MLTIDLQQGTVVRLREDPGTTITTRNGAVWVTEENSPHDVVLTPGESFTLARSGLTLVQAFRDTSLAIEPARGE